MWGACSVQMLEKILLRDDETALKDLGQEGTTTLLLTERSRSHLSLLPVDISAMEA